MKKIFAILAIAMIIGISAKAQTAYQPLVREGVRWIYQTETVYFQDYSSGISFYGLEFWGDTTIATTSGTMAFKKLYQMGAPQKSSYYTVDFTKRRPVAFVRETNRKIYCITPEALERAQWEYRLPDALLLYDFSVSDKATMFGEGGEYSKTYTLQGQADVAGRPCNVYITDNSTDKVVESIGLVSHFDGDLISARWYWEAGETEYWGLSHVVDNKNNVIFTGPNYGRFSGIEDIKADNANDPRWYSVTGVAYDTRPAQPGIYIHQGKKVVIK